MRKDITDDEEQLEYIAQWLSKKQMKKTARAVRKEQRRAKRNGRKDNE